MLAGCTQCRDAARGLARPRGEQIRDGNLPHTEACPNRATRETVYKQWFMCIWLLSAPVVDMRSLSWALLLPTLLAGSALASTFPVSSLKGGSSAPGAAVPNKFIVEVDSTSDIPTKRDVESREVSGPHTFFNAAWLTDPMQAHEALYDAMRKRGVSFGVDKEFNSQGLFVGAAVTLSVRTPASCSTARIC